MSIDLVKAKKTDLELFKIWHKRYIIEYRKTESRLDRQVNDHVNPVGWNHIDSNPIYWIKKGNMILGYVTTLVLSDSLHPNDKFNVIEDIFIDKKYRHNGIATFIRNLLRQSHNIQGVLIDKIRLINLGLYYVNQGFKSFNVLPEHNLLVIRYKEPEPDIGWISLTP
jgi:hypothetical protein